MNCVWLQPHYEGQAVDIACGYARTSDMIGIRAVIVFVAVVRFPQEGISVTPPSG